MKFKIVILILLSLFCIVLPPPVSAQSQPQPTFLEGKILNIQKDQQKVFINVEITEGNLKGKQYKVEAFDENQVKKQQLQAGNAVIISYLKNSSGNETVYIVDHVRRQSLLVLFFVFIAFVFIIGRWKGFLSFIGMLFSFVIIGKMIVPNIIAGTDPVVISLLGGFFIIPVTFYIAHGFNRNTTVAVVSTFLSLILTGALAYLFVNFSKLTGFAAEEAVYIQAFQGDSINIQSLLLAGIIIGAMGVLDDITISQTSIVEKLAQANPKYKVKDLFKHGMDVGRDHIASLVNTLVLVYAGAALPLFLLFYNTNANYQQIVNQEVVATEIVRTLVSSIGIIAAVPITTLLASIVVKKKK
jgi:uncharacterized membrane protein